MRSASPGLNGMRQSSPSLPSLSQIPTPSSDRGRGLADIAGRDPMDRRIEKEKKERYAQALREQMESGKVSSDNRIGRPASSDNRIGRPVDDSNWGTADKVSQVQEIMGQRIQSLHDEQQRMWERVKGILSEHESGHVEALAEKVASRMIEAALSRAVDEAVAAARRDCEAAVKHSTEGFAQQLGDLGNNLQSLHSGVDEHAAILADHETRIRRLEQAQEEWARDRADIQQEQKAVADELERLRNAQKEVAKDVAELPRLIQKLQRLEEEMPRLAARAAREALEKARPVVEPAPAPAPRPPTPPIMHVSAAAFAVLKNESELHELHGLTNTVGRATACDACIPGSQAVSNKHASIDFDKDGGTSLRDLGSRNGTFLNDRRVPEDNRGFMLQSGDAVKLGIDGPVFIFEYGPAAYARWPQDLKRASGNRPVTGNHRDAAGSRERGHSVDRRRQSERSPGPAARGLR